MFKTNKKRISILLVMAMVMTLLTGLAAPAAASTPVTGTVIGHVPTVAAAVYTSLASIRFAEAGGSIGQIQDGNTVTVTLPAGVVFQPDKVATYVYVGSGVSAAASFAPSNAYKSVLNDNSVTLTLERDISLFDAAAFALVLPVHITTVGTGAINATVTTNTTGISGGTFQVGTFGTAAVTVTSTGTVGNVSRFIPTPQLSAINVQLSENFATAFGNDYYHDTPADATNRVILTLPAGVTWAVPPITTGDITAAVDPANPGRLLVTKAALTETATTFNLSGIQLNVSRLAALGDLVVAVTGEGTNVGVTGSALLARVADFDITVRRPAAVITPPAINAGRPGPAITSIALIELVEATPGSLIATGTIDLTLPAGLRWGSATTVTATATGVTVPAGTRVSDAVYRFTVPAASTTPDTVTFTFDPGSILVSPTAATGDVVVAVSGTAGAAGNVTVATVRPVASFSAAATPVLGFGVVNQAAADITVSEAGAGRIVAGDMTFTLPAGVTFQGTPTVTRAAGNIVLGAAAVTGDNVLTIPVTTPGTVASTIYISGIRYNVGRFAFDGPINLTAGGTALVDETVTGFPAIRVANALAGVLAPPAPPASVFTIGALLFTRSGVDIPMDVAPSIVEGRTLLPLRFAALAVGVSGEDIIWDPIRRTVTLLRGDRVVQVQIGSRNMIINGVSVPLEVAPAIVSGRTVLPIRALATALRAGIVWDGIARTVTVTTN